MTQKTLLLFLLVEVEWRIYASTEHAIVASENGLSPVGRQTIIWTMVPYCQVNHKERGSVKFNLKFESFH